MKVNSDAAVVTAESTFSVVALLPFTLSKLQASTEGTILEDMQLQLKHLTTCLLACCATQPDSSTNFFELVSELAPFLRRELATRDPVSDAAGCVECDLALPSRLASTLPSASEAVRDMLDRATNGNPEALLSLWYAFYHSAEDVEDDQTDGDNDDEDGMTRFLRLHPLLQRARLPEVSDEKLQDLQHHLEHGLHADFDPNLRALKELCDTCAQSGPCGSSAFENSFVRRASGLATMFRAWLQRWHPEPQIRTSNCAKAGQSRLWGDNSDGESASTDADNRARPAKRSR